MQVGIVELMETGHIVLAETIARIFCSDPHNTVTIYTTGKHAGSLEFLPQRLPNLKIIGKPEEIDVKAFLQQAAHTVHDRVYVVTMNKLFSEFAGWQLSSPLFPVIHNLDEWFGLSPYQRMKKFINAGGKSRDLNSLAYLFKMYFIYPSFKKKILEKVATTGGKLVVLSEAIRGQLEMLYPGQQSEVIPFTVFDPSLARTDSDRTSPLRICVPGILSQYRRNYTGLLDLIEKSLAPLKNKFTIDLLGGVQPDNPLNQCDILLKKAEGLRRNGFSVIVHNVRFIPPEEYDRDLSSCDIILGNMNVVLNKYSRYGQTKETGLLFAMIKAGKPGILPVGYPIPEDIRSGILTYDSYDDLGRLLQELINDRNTVLKLREKALENSRRFSPDIIYNNLISA